MVEIRTKHLFSITLKAAAPQAIGRTPAGDRRVVEVTEGKFEGERLRGTVLTGGSDWIIARPDGTMALNVRLVLRTDDGALIGMTYVGLRHGPADVIARLNRGEDVDPASYYFRTAIQFETSADRYDWINRIIGVGTGHRRPDGPLYEVFEIL
jgi:hypothetical protein